MPCQDIPQWMIYSSLSAVPGGPTEPPHKKTRHPNLQKFFISCRSTREPLDIKQGWVIAWAQLGGTGRRSGHPCLTQFGFGFPSVQLNSTEGETRGGGGEDFTQEWGKNHFFVNTEGANQGKQAVEM